MPLRLFWSMVSHIEQITASEHLAQIDIAIATNAMGGGGEALSKLRESLLERLGTPVRHELPKSTRDDILALMNEV